MELQEQQGKKKKQAKTNAQLPKGRAEAATAAGWSRGLDAPGPCRCWDPAAALTYLLTPPPPWFSSHPPQPQPSGRDAFTHMYMYTHSVFFKLLLDNRGMFMTFCCQYLVQKLNYATIQIQLKFNSSVEPALVYLIWLVALSNICESSWWAVTSSSLHPPFDNLTLMYINVCEHLASLLVFAATSCSTVPGLTLTASPSLLLPTAVWQPHGSVRRAVTNNYFHWLSGDYLLH